MIVGASIKFSTTLSKTIDVQENLTTVLSLVGKVHWFDLITYRVCNGIFQTLIVSLIYSLIVLWFFSIDSGALFMRYWMFNWLSMTVFGLIIALVTVNLGLLANLFLTIFVFLMLASATLQITLELSPRFFRYGYGLPLYHIINGGRHLLFKSYSQFGIDVGVLGIYFGVLWIAAILTSILSIKRQQKKLRELALAKQRSQTNPTGNKSSA